MGRKKRKWWQTGEFEDGYQFGDIFRTVKNAISGDKEKSGNKDSVKVTKNIKDTNKRYVGLPEINNGRMSFDPVAQFYGFRNETERQNYIKENPNLYAVMGGVKYEPNMVFTNDNQKIIDVAIEADNEINNKYGSFDNYKKFLKDSMDEAYDNYQEVKKHKDFTILEQTLNVIGGIDMGDKRAREEYIAAAQKYYATEGVSQKNITSRIKELNSLINEPMCTPKEIEEYKKEMSHLNAAKGMVKDFSSYLEYGTSSIDAATTKMLTSLSATSDALIGQPLYGAMNLLGIENDYINQNRASRNKLNNAVDTKLVESAQTVGDKYVIFGNLTGAAIQTVPTVMMAYLTGGTSLAASPATPATTATAATGSSAITINSAKAIQAIKSLSKNPVYWTSFSMTYGTDYEQALEECENPIVATAYALTNSSINAYVEIGSGVEKLAGIGDKMYSGNQKALRWWKSAYEEGGEGFVQKTVSEVLSRAMYKGEYKDRKEFLSFLNELGYETAISALAGSMTSFGQITFEGIINYKSTNELSRLGETVITDGNSAQVISGLKEYFGKSVNSYLRETAHDIDVNKPDNTRVGYLYQKLCSDINTAINNKTNYTDVKEGLRSIISQAGAESKIIYSIALPQYFDAVSKLEVDINTAVNDVYSIMIETWKNDGKKRAISPSEIASFVSKDGSIKTIPQITEKDGIRMIDATTIMDEDAVVDGIWEGSRNTSNNESAENVENSQLETFDNDDYDWYNDGDIIIDGSHLVDGRLKPNIKYKSGEYDYIYSTDDSGRICKVYVEELHYTERVYRERHNPNTFGKLKGDHAGHLIADRFGGSKELDNLVSQSALVNLSKYKRIENQWARAIKKGQKVTINIEVEYNVNSMRPSGFMIEYYIDGRYYSESITN